MHMIYIYNIYMFVYVYIYYIKYIIYFILYFIFSFSSHLSIEIASRPAVDNSEISMEKSLYALETFVKQVLLSQMVL